MRTIDDLRRACETKDNDFSGMSMVLDSIVKFIDGLITEAYFLSDINEATE